MRRKNYDYKYERRTFVDRFHIIHTPKHKIYRLSMAVYTNDNKQLFTMTDAQFAYFLSVYKWPSLYYKEKLDILIDGYPGSFVNK